MSYLPFSEARCTMHQKHHAHRANIGCQLTDLLRHRAHITLFHPPFRARTHNSAVYSTYQRIYTHTIFNIIIIAEFYIYYDDNNMYIFSLCTIYVYMNVNVHKKHKNIMGKELMRTNFVHIVYAHLYYNIRVGI